MQPNEALGLGQFLIRSVENEHKTTRKVLAAVPDEGAEYRPDSKSMSAFDLAWHIASTEPYFMGAIFNGEFKGGDRPEHVKKPSDVVKYYDEAVAQMKEQLKTVTPEQLSRVVDFRGFMQWPAVMYLQLMMLHSSHHRGQLSVYLRPMGAKVPGIYGPSADEPIAAKA